MKVHNHPLLVYKRYRENETHRYGIIDPIEQKNRSYQVRQFVEKPAQGTAPSNLAIMGRYVLTPKSLCSLKTNRQVLVEKFS